MDFEASDLNGSVVLVRPHSTRLTKTHQNAFLSGTIPLVPQQVPGHREVQIQREVAERDSGIAVLKEYHQIRNKSGLGKETLLERIITREETDCCTMGRVTIARRKTLRL